MYKMHMAKNILGDEQRNEIARLFKMQNERSSEMESRLSKIETNVTEVKTHTRETLTSFKGLLQRNDNAIQEITTTTIPALHKDLSNLSKAAERKIIYEFQEMKTANTHLMMQIMAKLNENTTAKTVSNNAMTSQAVGITMKTPPGNSLHNATLVKIKDVKPIRKSTRTKKVLIEQYQRRRSNKNDGGNTIDIDANEYDETSEMDGEDEASSDTEDQNIPPGDVDMNVTGEGA
jgi:hypothetical protein